MTPASARASSETVLAGDIGGTKTNLGIFEPSDTPRPAPVLVRNYINADYGGFLEIIEDFFSGAELCGPPKTAAFGLAGMVDNGRSVIDSLSWEVDERVLAERFGFEEVALVNDLVATGYGVELLEPGEVHTLQRGSRRPGNIALLAAGTGLGESILFWDGESHIPIASEGGHTDFAPRNALEVEILTHLTASYGQVSYERLLSGEGLVNIFEFLKAKRGLAGDEASVGTRVIVGEAIAALSEERPGERGELSKEALEIFVSILGAEAGNLALKALTCGGVYIGGGLPPKVLRAFEGSAFLDSFSGKGRMKGFLSDIPVKIILNEETALLGAAALAMRLLRP